MGVGGMGDGEGGKGCFKGNGFHCDQITQRMVSCRDSVSLVI